MYNDLEELGHVRRIARGVYQITEQGTATAKNMQTPAASMSAPTAATAPTPEGGAVQHDTGTLEDGPVIEGEQAGEEVLKRVH